jgi:membrane protease YdiL (CAAX protease family)
LEDAGATQWKIAAWRRRLGHGRLFFVVELALFSAVFIADRHHHIYLSKTPYWLALAWLSMALRGVPWRAVGLCLRPDWIRLAILGAAAGVAMELLELFVTQPLLVRLTGKYPDLSVFRPVVGNVELLLVMLAGSWLLAALGEELVWRGYALNRLADMLGRPVLGWAASLVAVSVAFGMSHSNQDITGIAENIIDGLLLGGLYLGSGRNLIAPIVAHGMTDTIDSLIVFSGHYPGM